MSANSDHVDRVKAWNLEPILSWLRRSGRRIDDPSHFLQGLCERLLSAGAPLLAVRFGFETVDPQVLLWGFSWERKENRAQEVRLSHGVRNSDAYVGSPVQKVHETGRLLRRNLTDLDPDKDHQTYLDWAARGGSDYLILPTIFSTGSINIFAVVTDRKSGFSDQDVAAFSELADYLTPVLEVFATRRMAASLLNTYVGSRTGERILQGLIKRGDGEIINAALWLSDLRDFSHYSESLSSQQLLTMLNAYFECVAAAVSARGGEILKFIGDAVLVIFPANEADSGRGACAAALEAATDAFDTLAVLNHQRRRMGEPEIRFGVGLHLGEVVYGNVGAPDRLDFTVIGPAVNLTARLESLTKTLNIPMICSQAFADSLQQPLDTLGLHRFKGIEQPLQVYTLPA